MTKYILITMNNEIHVVINRLDLSDDYNRHAGATMASVLENCSRPVIFHITHDGNKSFKNMSETNANIAKYQELVSKYGSRVEFHDLDKFEWDKRLPKHILQKWPSICLSRLYFHKIFPTIDIIYLLGADAIVNLDLSNIGTKYPVDNYCISGCLDTTFYSCFDNWVKPVIKYYANIGIIKTEYCNADVMVFNLKKIRSNALIEDEIYKFLDENQQPWLNEQDVLNSIYRNDKYLLPQQYNIQTRSIEDIQRIVSISADAGYTQHSKFWERYIGDADCTYWKYLTKTPWGRDKDLFTAMGKSLTSPKDLIENIDTIIKGYPIRKIILFLWKFTIPLYIKLLKEFRQYIKKGKIDYEHLGGE